MKKILCLIVAIPALCFAQSFEDVPEIHPHFQAIEWLYSNGLVEGYSVGRKKEFRPEQEVSRAAAIKMLIGVSGVDVIETKESSFSDVPSNEWFFPFIETVVNLEVVEGFPDGKFYPASSVTRAEMLAMTFRIFHAPISENEEEDWTVPFFDLAHKLGIIDTDAEVHSVLNRGEVAELLYRARKVAETGFENVFRFAGEGFVTAYSVELNGKKTANGDSIDPNSMTAAHKNLPFGTRVRIWNENHSIVVKINDRLPEDASLAFVLSQKAFLLLADKYQQKTNVAFEVFSTPSDEQPAVPEYIRPNLSDDKRVQPPLPDSISEKIAELRGQLEQPTKIKPLFTETVSMLATSFFEKFTMRRPLPQKIVAGTVLNFSGSTHERKYEKMTVFLQPITNDGEKIGEQDLFTGEISGKNFSFPVVFDTAGKFLIGAVLDNEKRSRVETIEVVELNRHPLMSMSKKEFETEFDVRILPERQTVIWDLPKLDSTDLLKISFAQQSLHKSLFLYGGIDTLELPYTFFSQFQSQENLAVDIYAAESNDGTLPQRTSGWTKLSYKNFDLVPGFLDVETEKVSVHDFPRWRRDLNEFTISGKVLSPDVTLDDYAFVTTPRGHVKKISYVRDGDHFSFSVNPKEWGAYAIEVVADDGEVLFNRELYCTEKWVLPVFPPQSIKLPSDTVPGVRAWVNRVRDELNLAPVIASAELNEFAQNYADRMAQENFFSHTSPTGQTFKSRLKAAHLEGVEFGENLGMGSSLQIALDGLRSSGSHFKNLSARKWEKIGIGISRDGEDWYVTQVFSR